jgi:hypothetical protein
VHPKVPPSAEEAPVMNFEDSQTRSLAPLIRMLPIADCRASNRIIGPAEFSSCWFIAVGAGNKRFSTAFPASKDADRCRGSAGFVEPGDCCAAANGEDAFESLLAPRERSSGEEDAVRVSPCNAWAEETRPPGRLKSSGAKDAACSAVGKTGAEEARPEGRLKSSGAEDAARSTTGKTGAEEARPEGRLKSSGGESLSRAVVPELVPAVTGLTRRRKNGNSTRSEGSFDCIGYSATRKSAATPRRPVE